MAPMASALSLDKWRPVASIELALVAVAVDICVRNADAWAVIY